MILFISVLTLFSCGDAATLLQEEKTYIVASKIVDCVGVGPQKCYLVKENMQNDWQFFYTDIKGFTHEEGFEYEILVSLKEVENPPQDTSSIEYTLIKVVSKIEKYSENLPK